MACVRLAWVLGGLVIPAGDQRSGVPLGLGWCFLLIGHTSLSLSRITERVFSFDLDPLFPQISFSKRRTLQDPPRGGVQTAGLLSECLTPPRPDLEKRKNPVCHFVTPLDGSVEVDEHRRPEVLGRWWALTREKAVTHEGGARAGSPQRKAAGQSTQGAASWWLLHCEMRRPCGGTWPLIPHRGSPFSGQADPRTWGFLQTRLTLCFPLISVLLWKSAGEAVGGQGRHL